MVAWTQSQHKGAFSGLFFRCWPVIYSQYSGWYIMGAARVLRWGPCPFGLPGNLTVAQRIIAILNLPYINPRGTPNLFMGLRLKEPLKALNPSRGLGGGFGFAENELEAWCTVGASIITTSMVFDSDSYSIIYNIQIHRQNIHISK